MKINIDMDCKYCEIELPNNARFCPKCLHQLVCLNCGDVLFKDSPICISCGKPIEKNESAPNTAVNNIEYTENEKGKIFKASFTDTVAGNVVETFAQLLPSSKYSAKKELPFADLNQTSVNSRISIVDSESIEYSEPNEQEQKNSDLALLEKIFKIKNDVITIYDPRIKAKSRNDFTAKITLLYIYYRNLQGEQEVQRSELNEFLGKEKLYDGAFRSWLSQNRTLIDNNQTYLGLRPEGRENAQKILLTFSDPSIPNIWDLKSNGKRSPKDNSNDILTNKSKNRKKTTNPQLVSSLNLKPKNNKSLTDFYSEYKVSNNFESNLLFIYYLEKIINESNITSNHIYTCYKEMKRKVPAIYQSLVDTKNRKGWIDTSNMNELKTTVAGENHLEHEMIK